MDTRTQLSESEAEGRCREQVSSPQEKYPEPHAAPDNLFIELHKVHLHI